jgi:hypothetical protein
MQLRILPGLLLVLGAWFASPVAGAANRVQNSDFDVDASSWLGVGLFDPGLDAGGDPGSGSLHVQNDAPNTGTSSTQRFTISSPAPLRVSSCTRIASGQSAEGVAEVGLNFWAGSCEALGDYLEFAQTSLLAAPFDTWVCIEVPELVQPVGAGCAVVTLFVRNVGAGEVQAGSFSANVDAVVAPEPHATAAGLGALGALAGRVRRSNRNKRSA